jgi:hypothetical protein
VVDDDAAGMASDPTRRARIRLARARSGRPWPRVVDLSTRTRTSTGRRPPTTSSAPRHRYAPSTRTACTGCASSGRTDKSGDLVVTQQGPTCALTCRNVSEPPVGIEPTTYALRAASTLPAWRLAVSVTWGDGLTGSREVWSFGCSPGCSGTLALRPRAASRRHAAVLVLSVVRGGGRVVMTLHKLTAGDG